MPTGATHEKWGSVNVSRFPAHLHGRLDEALSYLKQSPTFLACMAQVNARGITIFLEHHQAHTRLYHRDPQNLRIEWAPNLGLADMTGYLTPAVLLAHEFAHARYTPEQRETMLAQPRPSGFDCAEYGVEEACVIREVEGPVCAELNEARKDQGLEPLETATRFQYRIGRLIEVAGPVAPHPGFWPD